MRIRMIRYRIKGIKLVDYENTVTLLRTPSFRLFSKHIYEQRGEKRTGYGPV